MDWILLFFFFTIIFCFLHPLTIHYKQVRNIIRIDSIIVYILFLTVNNFYATLLQEVIKY
jgi:NADH:ubiquinone oxidoreductase subunit 3 (subunit A)